MLALPAVKVTLVPEHILLSTSLLPNVTVGKALIVINSVSVKSTLQPLLALVATTLIVTEPAGVNPLLVRMILPPLPPTTLLIAVPPSNNW
jgi:hypothetical protein